MALRFRRNHGSGLKSLLGKDSDAVSRALGADRNGGGDEVDLEHSVGNLFDAAPTHDVESLKESGTSADRFYSEEIAPNWDGLSKEERAAKVEAFARFANVLGADDPGGMGAVVRTKLLLLAWAYDACYGESLTRQLARKPEQFGRLELSSAG